MHAARRFFSKSLQDLDPRSIVVIPVQLLERVTVLRIGRKTSAWGAAAIAATLILAQSGTQPASAQAGQCTQACHASYAECYKRTASNRKVCEAQLQQCLAGCISKR